MHWKLAASSVVVNIDSITASVAVGASFDTPAIRRLLELVAETDVFERLEGEVRLCVQFKTITTVSPYERLMGIEIGRRVSIVFPPNLRGLTSAPCKIYL